VAQVCAPLARQRFPTSNRHLERNAAFPPRCAFYFLQGHALLKASQMSVGPQFVMDGNARAFDAVGANLMARPARRSSCLRSIQRQIMSIQIDEQRNPKTAPVVVLAVLGLIGVVFAIN
jgi:hypothetical protein